METQEVELHVWLEFGDRAWWAPPLESGCSGAGEKGLPLVPDDEVEEVLGEVSPSGLQGAAQLLAAMTEGAGEVEVFIATREREQVGTLSSQTPVTQQTPNSISPGKTPLGL